MMPGIKRRLRLLADWTVDLLFPRDGSELGVLGHPPKLEAQSAGGTVRADAEPQGDATPAGDGAVTVRSSD